MRSQVREMMVTRLDVVGTFVRFEPQENYRVLGIIVKGPEGLVFFKLTGPRAQIEKILAQVDALVDSLRRAPDPGAPPVAMSSLD